MEVKSPREWDQSQLEAVRATLDTPGWKLWEEYVNRRLEEHKESLVNAVLTPEAPIFVGRIKEIKYILGKMHKAFIDDAKKRKKAADEAQSKTLNP